MAPNPTARPKWHEDTLRVGSGPPLVLLHGWPFHNQCFRKVLPELSKHFTCYAPNALGMNAAGYEPDTDFSFQGHTRRVLEFADAEGLNEFMLLGHDTGGTVARLVAADAGARITKLVLLSTEIPHHRPPFIPLYQKSSYLPGNRLAFTRLLSSTKFLRSAMGFGGAFVDKSQIDEEFTALFASHWIDEQNRFPGLIRYLRGIDFAVVDNLPAVHQQLRQPTKLIWGDQDITFPTAEARQMTQSLANCAGFDVIKDAAFLSHEEQPGAVANSVVEFLR